jgi:hypothetical protein
MTLNIQAFWGDVPFIIRINHICWTATMKAQENLENSVIICQSEGHNMLDYWSPRQTAARTSELTIMDLFLLFQFRYTLE